MDAVAEGHVAVVAAADVEAVGFGELLRVPVGGALHGPDALSRPKPFASQFKVGYHHPGNALDGAVVAQAFLDGGGDQGRVLLQFPQLFGMSQQGQQAVADQAGGGFVTASKRKEQIPNSSAWLSRSPPASTAIRSLIRSARGCRRRWSNSPPR